MHLLQQLVCQHSKLRNSIANTLLTWLPQCRVAAMLQATSRLAQTLPMWGISIWHRYGDSSTSSNGAGGYAVPEVMVSARQLVMRSHDSPCPRDFYHAVQSMWIFMPAVRRLLVSRYALPPVCCWVFRCVSNGKIGGGALTSITPLLQWPAKIQQNLAVTLYGSCQTPVI